jgi:hypothetical protein
MKQALHIYKKYHIIKRQQVYMKKTTNEEKGSKIISKISRGCILTLKL